MESGLVYQLGILMGFLVRALPTNSPRVLLRRHCEGECRYRGLHLRVLGSSMLTAVGLMKENCP